jgi:hypothetical protein
MPSSGKISEVSATESEDTSIAKALKASMLDLAESKKAADDDVFQPASETDGEDEKWQKVQPDANSKVIVDLRNTSIDEITIMDPIEESGSKRKLKAVPKKFYLAGSSDPRSSKRAKSTSTPKKEEKELKDYTENVDK